MIDDIPKDDFSNYLKNLNKADLFLFVNFISKSILLFNLLHGSKKSFKADDGIILHSIEERKDDLNFHMHGYKNQIRWFLGKLKLS